jgi:NADH dehydrogenase
MFRGEYDQAAGCKNVSIGREERLQNGGQMSGSLFVTGAAGYVGSRLLPALNSYRIYCLARRKPVAPPPNAVFLEGDLLDRGVYAKVLAECETVVHLAAATGKCRPEEYFRVNREGTRALVEESRRAGVKNFLFISTIAAKFQDQHRYYYAQSKRQAEEIVAAAGLRFLVVRPTMIMGKGAAVLQGLSRLAAAPVIPIFGNGRAVVQPVAVDDLNGCLAKILEEGAFDNRTVEIGGPERLTMQELLLKIRRSQSGREARVVHLPAGLIAGTVGMLESLLLPLLPFTAGQIASFVNDGTAVPDPRVAGWRPHMMTVDQMLA